MKGIIKDILLETQQRFKLPAHRREAKLDTQLSKLQAVIGPRRAGKSSLLKLAIASLLEQGIGWDKICYLSLEDERLRGLPGEPDQILQAFQELYPQNPLLKDVHFILDEVQYLASWEPFINRIYEQISGKVIITGSNSRTLHTDVSGVLRGRGIAIELLPLSFSEYLVFKNIEYAAHGPDAAGTRAAFDEYLTHGGFPETVDMESSMRRQVLQEYFNAMLYRDIIDQHPSANTVYLRYLYHRIADHTGKPLSLAKIFRELKSQGYAVSKNSLYEMASIGEDVYMFKRISKFDPSMIRRENTDKKAYFMDNGLWRGISGQFSQDFGKLFENLVFWHLYRQYGSVYTTDIYYYQDVSHECDFILYKEGSQALPVQACYRLDAENTRLRELKGLYKACQITNSPLGIIITLDQEEEFEYRGLKIKVVPAWKWCGGEFELDAL